MHDRRFRVTSTILTILTFLVILTFVGLVLVSFPLAKSFLVGVAIWLAIILVWRVWAQVPRRARIFTIGAVSLVVLLILAVPTCFVPLRAPGPPIATGTPTPMPTPTVPIQVKTDSFSVEHELELELKDNTLISHERYLIASTKDVAVEQIIIAKPAGEITLREGYSLEEKDTEFVVTGSFPTDFGLCAIAPGGEAALAIDRTLTTDPLGFLTRRATLPLLTNKIDLVFAGRTYPRREQLSYFEVNRQVEFLLPPHSFLRGNPPPDSPEATVTADGEIFTWKKSEKAQLGRREETITVHYADVPIGSGVIRTVIGRLASGEVIDEALTGLGGILTALVGKDPVLRWSKTLIDRVRARLRKEESSTDSPS